MAQQVTLSGGPFDGQKIEWEGGDLIRMVIGSPLGFKRDGDGHGNGLQRQYTPPEALYRRSLSNRDIFVFQP